MRRAKLTVQLADVKTIFKSFAVEIQTSDLSDLREEEVMKLIKKAGGANYDRQASDYWNSRWIEDRKFGNHAESVSSFPGDQNKMSSFTN